MTTTHIRRYIRRNIRRNILATIAISGFSGLAFADSSEQAAPSFSLNIGAGYSVYKSELVQSNDTSTTINYGFGVYGGQKKTIGIFVNREQGSYAFELNAAKITTLIQDVHLRYRYGPVYLGAVLNTTQFEVTAPPDADGNGFLDQDTAAEEYMKVINTGFGGNVGANIVVTKRTYVYVDVSSVTTGLVNQTYVENTDTTTNGYTDKEITFGQRADIDLGGSIGLTKDWLNLNFGIKQRTMSITVDGDTFNEQLSNTYFGLKAGWNF